MARQALLLQLGQERFDLGLLAAHEFSDEAGVERGTRAPQHALDGPERDHVGS